MDRRWETPQRPSACKRPPRAFLHRLWLAAFGVSPRPAAGHASNLLRRCAGARGKTSGPIRENQVDGTSRAVKGAYRMWRARSDGAKGRSLG